MKRTESSEVWDAIRDLWKWRKQNDHEFLEKLHKGSETHKEAFYLWKAHPREDVFFAANELRPES